MRPIDRPSFLPRLLRAAILLVIWWLLVGAAPALAQVTVKLPYIKIVQPANDSVWRKDLQIKAECITDSPPCHLTVMMPDFAAGGVGTPIDSVVRLEDGRYSLFFTATDAAGLPATAYRVVYVSSDDRLSVADTFQGAILDVDAGRALTFDDTVIPAVVRLYDRAADTSQIIWTAASTRQYIQEGFLTPGGALFRVREDGPQPDPLLFEWRGGALTQIASAAGIPVVKGNWAVIYGRTAPPPAGTGVFLRNLTTGASVQVSPHLVVGSSDVTPDGRVVFSASVSSQPSQIFEFNPNPYPGTTTQLTTSPQSSFDPLTDGINVVFTRGQGPQMSSIVLRTQAGVEEVLATGLTSVTPGGTYQIAGGWTAFVRRDGIWIREPNGTVRQVSPSGYIEALDESGDLIYLVRVTVGLESKVTRYLAKAGGFVRELGSVSTAAFIDGAPALIAGNQVMDMSSQPTRAILAEGATGTFFSTDVAILNPAEAPVPVTVRYFREGQTEISEERELPARSRTTIHLDDVEGLDGASVSTQIDGPPGAPLVVERLMSWDATGYSGHLGNAVDGPRSEWYFAEGAQGYFSTFFLVANGGMEEANVRFRFFVEGGGTAGHIITVPPASRRTFYAGDLPELVNRSFATVIESDVPVVAERAMYFGDSPFWVGGHGSAGVGVPALDWFHAEGATGSLFDTFILLANPHHYSTRVNVTFITDTGVTVTREKSVPAHGRLTINIEEESPELASANVSTRVHSIDHPIVSERAMYWGTTGTGWRETHNSFGVTASGLKWGLAEGRSGGERGYQTYVLVSNSTDKDADLKVTFIREDGVAVEKTYAAKAGERLNIPASALEELAGSNFATIVESINHVPINVESALYWNAGGVVWESGGNTVATRIP